MYFVMSSLLFTIPDSPTLSASSVTLLFIPLFWSFIFWVIVCKRNPCENLLVTSSTEKAVYFVLYCPQSSVLLSSIRLILWGHNLWFYNSFISLSIFNLSSPIPPISVEDIKWIHMVHMLCLLQRIWITLWGITCVCKEIFPLCLVFPASYCTPQ